VEVSLQETIHEKQALPVGWRMSRRKGMGRSVWVAETVEAVLFGATDAEATTYYVAKNGNDDYPGTEAQPWLTTASSHPQGIVVRAHK
jgi:hypothetical protein